MLAATIPNRTRARLPRAPVQRVTAEFIRDLAPWHWFATLTFRTEVTADAAHRAFRTWARGVASSAETHVTAAWAYEARDVRRVLHFHALLAPHENVNRIDVRSLSHAWQSYYDSGEATFSRVYSTEGAADYLAKHPAWDVNVACPRRPECRRAAGCVKAPGPWHPSGAT